MFVKDKEFMIKNSQEDEGYFSSEIEIRIYKILDRSIR